MFQVLAEILSPVSLDLVMAFIRAERKTGLHYTSSYAAAVTLVRRRLGSIKLARWRCSELRRGIRRQATSPVFVPVQDKISTST